LVRANKPSYARLVKPAYVPTRIPDELHSASYHRMRLRAEARAHRLLGHARLHLEWFDLDDQAVQDWLSERSAQEGFQHALAEELLALLVNR
jgi:hypothetical protein